MSGKQSGVHVILDRNLASHKKSKTQFQVCQLVTIQFDFEQNTSDNQSFTIQTGQTGIISY